MTPLLLTFILAAQSPAAEAAPDELSPRPAYTPIEALPARPGSKPVDAKPAPAEGKRLLVLDLVDKGAGPEINESISQAVAGQALKSHAGTVVTTEQIRVALDAASNAALVGCESEKCMVDVGQQVEADLVLSGNVTKVADDVVIRLIVVNARDGARISEQSRKVPANRDLYYYAAQQLASLALTGKATDAKVPVRIVASEPGARVLVDGRDVGEAPFVAAVDPGLHNVQVELDGFSPWRTQIKVDEAAPMEITATLVEKGTDLWPAAIVSGGVGVAAAVGAVVAAIAAQDAFDGALGVFGSPERSYLGLAPASSAELASRRQDVQRLALLTDSLWVIAGVGALAAGGLVAADAILE